MLASEELQPTVGRVAHFGATRQATREEITARIRAKVGRTTAPAPKVPKHG
jgi:hypothetical protein